MANRGHWVQKITDQTYRYGQSLPGVPIVEIAGDRRVLVERHGGVVEYGPQRIRVRVDFGMICIMGCNMQLKQMTNQQLIISGQIDAIQLQRRC